MSSTVGLNGSAADWLADRAFRGIIAAALKLPYERRLTLMGTAMRRTIGPLAGYRKRAEANLALIYPDWSDQKRRDIADACCDNFGRTLIENYSWQEFGQRLAHVQPAGSGLPRVIEAAKIGRPIIFVTAHFGNHEAPRHVLTRMGYVIGGLYRPMQNPYFNAHYAKTMTSWGGPVFEQGRRGTMGFARHLKSGGMGTLLFDVSAKGITLPFLGHPARTATSAADIARKLDALVVPYFGVRQPDGTSFEVEVQEPVPHSEPAGMMANMTERLEAMIARYPEQWFWVHRRWKGR
ncbi:MAG: lauroyl acyltransferase [Pseudomonadota bacterium]